MIGALRFLLAIGVLVAHLVQQYPGQPGMLAVFGFYTVSGYLIARVLQGSYRGRPLAFVLNRALRLYPAYWAVALLGLWIALHGGSPLNAAIAVPNSFDAAIRQISIFGLLPLNETAYPIRLIPPSWSLNMELAWYLAMILTVRHIRLWLACGIVIAVWLSWRNDVTSAYNGYYGPAFCFALGAALSSVKVQLHRAHVGIAFGALVLWVVFVNMTGFAVWKLYGASVLSGYALLACDRKFSAWQRYDKWIGDLAYPVFLCHWHVATFMNMQPGWDLFWVSLPLILALSSAIVLLVDRPVARIRDAIRAGQARSLATQPAE
ncbi:MULTISPECIES: acyltransferase family protein [unclassified Mesorhizobium]|uniref:acyltransferase family protein n=1 Tax=unclassified Mesorhizobium TaxID=325217 RepID=UPI001126700F|nr:MULTISPECIES: acyltransferase [unclassified Mesorhizobium]MBZ9704597.1 acyltransferase [Mesorhizobium sp. CO1-1-3]MBZ9950357.1 acyltransferase [Mesorhizobium sp. BR1-1-11]TPI98020.1 acyltransferase [Mesorhizobium sp. B2-8-1]